MSGGLRLAVADDEPEMIAFYERFLPRLGHTIVSSAETGPELVEQCRLGTPDLVIADIRMPGLDGLAAAQAIQQIAPTPVILVSAHLEPGWDARAESAGVRGYLLKPVTEQDLGPAITLARRQFEHDRALRQEATDLRRALEERKILERAKGIVTHRLGITEDEAFRRIRKMSTSENRKLVDVAQSILAADQIFQQLENRI